MTTYTIGEAAKISGLQTHTLRYYEAKEIILPQRNVQNRRVYDNKDIKWLEILVLLKSMGLSLKQLKEYATIYYHTSSRNSALDILTQQQRILLQQQKIISQQLKQVKQKVAFLNESDVNLATCQNKNLAN